jgi:hypothetical protein
VNEVTLSAQTGYLRDLKIVVFGEVITPGDPRDVNVKET